MTKTQLTDISASVVVDAPAEQVFAATTDWGRQGEWMIGTTVSGELPIGTGSKLQAFSGIGRLGFMDTMTVTAWDPPRRCDVVHTGKLVRGTGSFVVEPLTTDTSRFTWTEALELPFGFIGRVGWMLMRPFFKLGLKLSLKRFSKWAAEYQLARTNTTNNK